MASNAEARVPGLQEFNNFGFPDILSERVAIEKAASNFALDNAQGFVQRFERVARASRVVPLEEDVWSKLENTDSYQVGKGEWSKVRQATFKSGNGSDWKDIKGLVETGNTVDAPIILKVGDRVHLVSGNTRLMVCHAMGVTPGVLIVDMSGE